MKVGILHITSVCYSAALQVMPAISVYFLALLLIHLSNSGVIKLSGRPKAEKERRKKKP